jgi:hypothetical protein
MNKLKQLANQFRGAIDAAVEVGAFNNKHPFSRFPCGCCGDACDLLSQYLLDNSIKTYNICGTYRDGSFETIQSHTWLLTDGEIIIDITGDQFRNDSVFLNYDKPVYVGTYDNFHKLFDVDNRSIYENNGLEALGDASGRLRKLYQEIIRFL